MDFKKVILAMSKERQYVLYWKIHGKNDIDIAEHFGHRYDWTRKHIKIIYQTFGWTEWSNEEKRLHLQTEIKPIIDEIVAENPDILGISPPPPPVVLRKEEEKPVVPEVVETQKDPEGKLPEDEAVIPPVEEPEKKRKPVFKRVLGWALWVVVGWLVLTLLGMAYDYFVSPRQTPPPVTESPQQTPTQTAETQTPTIEAPTPILVSEDSVLNITEDVSMYLDYFALGCPTSGDWTVGIGFQNDSADDFTMEYNSGGFIAIDGVGTVYTLVATGEPEPLPEFGDRTFTIQSGGNALICLSFSGQIPSNATYIGITAYGFKGFIPFFVKNL